MNLVRAIALLGAAVPAWAQYAGPAILLRGEAPAPMQGAAIDFRPFFAFSVGYVAGLSGVSVNPAGNTINDASLELEVSGGVSGNHAWKHLKLGLDYHGSLRHSPKFSFYDGTDQSLKLGITDRITRHATLTLRQSAGLMSNNFSQLSLNPAVPFDPSSAYIPTSDFYDNRTIYVSTQADLVIQKSARLSFDFGGDGFLQRRRSSALYGVTGAGARGDMQYRLSRRSTIGVGYTYTHYSFTGIFSSTDLHGLVGTYAIRLSRNLEFSGYGGVMRVETKFVQAVPLDPAIAALLGLTAVREVAYQTSYIPNLSLRLSHTVQHGVFFISGGHSVLPGNGVFLTSTSTNVGAGYAYTGLKHWSINMGVGYSKAHSRGNVVGAYGGYSGSASISRQLVRSTHGFLSASFNKYDSSNFHNYNRWTYTVQLGLAFAPGDVALRLW
ncbi:MAG TPA: hypothetical protein VNY05_42045 [Candidatus Acidoferrales bacterium]|nr:hypothetical protein [Candidatus Acidoferrales bacterium]